MRPWTDWLWISAPLYPSLLLAAALAAALAAFLRARRKLARLSRQVETVRTLGKTLKPIQGFLNRSEAVEILAGVVRIVKDYMQADFAAVSVLNEEKDSLNVVQYLGIPQESPTLQEQLSARWKNTLSGYAITAKKPLLAQTPDDFPILDKPPNFASGIAVPIQTREKVFGVLSLGSKNTAAFDSADLLFAELLSDLLCVVVSHLFQVVQVEKKRSEPISSEAPTAPEEVLSELAVARAVQARMLPRELPKIEGVDLAAKLVQAKEVGGDFYDCFILREGALAINVGDVSGKSIPAALLTSMAKYIFRFPPSMYIRPAKLMELANKMVYLNGGGLFITDCFATLDLATRQLVYVNAGHPPPIQYRAKIAETVFLPSTGIVLGAAEDTRYREETTALSPGDTVLFYSDCFTEVKTEDGMLGEEGLAKLFKSLQKHEPARLVDELSAEMLRMYEIQKQSPDDLTCLVLKIR